MGIFTHIKLGIVVASIIAVGYFVWSYQDMKIKLANETAIKEVAEANLKVAEQTINILRKMENSHEAIENAPNDNVADYLRTGVWPNRSDKKRDGVPTSPKSITPRNAPRG